MAFKVFLGRRKAELKIFEKNNFDRFWRKKPFFEQSLGCHDQTMHARNVLKHGKDALRHGHCSAKKQNANNLKNDIATEILKGFVNVITSDPPCKDGFALFTMAPLKP